MKNSDLESLLQGINRCGNIAKQPFRNKMMFNAREIRAELTLLGESLSRPKGWEDYEKAQKVIVDTYAIGYNANGPIFGDNQEQVNKEFTELKKANAPMLDEMRKLAEDYDNNVMKAEVSSTLKLRLIEETELPRELTLEQCMGIDLLINYNAETGKKE